MANKKMKSEEGSDRYYVNPFQTSENLSVFETEKLIQQTRGSFIEEIQQHVPPSDNQFEITIIHVMCIRDWSVYTGVGGISLMFLKL